MTAEGTTGAPTCYACRYAELFHSRKAARNYAIPAPMQREGSIEFRSSVAAARAAYIPWQPATHRQLRSI
jgi:hypothetical protein